MKPIPEFDRLVAISGISIFGVREIGFLRDDALSAIDILRNADRLILGGDVYFRRGEKIESALANWSVEPKLQESRSSYAERSWATAENYVKAFREPAEALAFFAFTIADAVFSRA